MLQKILTIKYKPLSQGIKSINQRQKLVVDGIWKVTKGLPPLRRPKLSKKPQDKYFEIKNYTKLIGIGMIGNSNGIGRSLSDSIQEGKSK